MVSSGEYGPYSVTCSIPVSYTHLDVYKRQVTKGSSITIIIAVSPNPSEPSTPDTPGGDNPGGDTGGDTGGGETPATP